MNIETMKWIYQRVSTPIISILFAWFIYNIFLFNNYSYESINIFFNNIVNSILFITLILLSLFHTSIEVFHSISDYFRGTKNEIKIKFFVSILYIIIFFSIITFLYKFLFL